MRMQVVTSPPIPSPRRTTDHLPATVTPPARRRIASAGLSLAGVALGAVFYCLSFTPSLLPRVWFLQGMVAGVTAAMGYGLGAALEALVRRFRGPMRPHIARIAWAVLAITVPVLVAVFLWLGNHWQQDLRIRLGMEPAPDTDIARTVSVSLLTFTVLLVIARLLRLATHGCAFLFRRAVPVPAAYCAGTLVVAVLSYTAFDGLLVANLFAMADRSAAVVNNGTGNGVTVPVSGLRSGGPGSAVSWDSLGRQGRAFVAGAPSTDELTAFAGRPAVEPIRLYGGLASALTVEDRARLVVREMDRTGAFDRSVIAVFTPTGTGWVDNKVTRSLEYMYAGDSALVSMQYSYLPSFFAFMGDRSEVVDAADALIGAVRDRWATMPAGDRPRLLLFGESLGTYGMETTFGTPEALVDGADGALLLGPTFANPAHRELTENRAAGSPVWDPHYPQLPIEFADDATELRDLTGPRPKVVYLQNATDPVVWWSWDLLWQKPQWLIGKRAADVTPDMHWYPGITFWQITCDLVFSNKVPTGHGHVYKSETVDGWAAIAPPPGWTTQDSLRLRALLDR
ncbi:alpha/beta hydrolase [Actinoplanes couchii]|uniref:Membrane protein n=1 Tax=Actinoplanes couchii TaxID=403638 RepID=A0ABQ3X991_9ACTN|nr:alpha/beta-hydrolase family protein [Actinoplanes couchii]MDR6325826.1 putative membrane protein [Actinoplanes couchii]GID55005.1 membrane protein [Actinoplanes couchii]